MKSLLSEIRITALAVTLFLLAFWLTSAFSSFPKRGDAATEKTLNRIAEKLDAQVERGRYQRVDRSTILDKDSWGNRVRIEYREEGLGERLRVSSAGPDAEFDTQDDITVTRWLMNANGIGERIHDGTASTAAEATKGVVTELKNSFKKAIKRESGLPNQPTEQ